MVAEDVWVLLVLSSLLFADLGKRDPEAHLSQVNCLQSQLPQALSPIDVGLRSTSNTSTTEL